MCSDDASNVDFLNFGEVSQLAIDVLDAPGMLPVSIGIFGNWGSGKSSVINIICQQLENDNRKNIIVHFDAWLYQGFDDARASFLEVITKQLAKEAEGNKTLTTRIKTLFKRIRMFRALGIVAEGALLYSGIPTAGVVSKGFNTIDGIIQSLGGKEGDKIDFDGIEVTSSTVKEKLTSLMKDKYDDTPTDNVEKFREDYSIVLKSLDRPMIVLIDNLDRCLPSNMIHILEAIRLFLFLPNTAYIIAADEEMVRTAVAEHFKGSSARHQIDYIDKLIQVPIRIPKAGVREIRSYLYMLFAIDYGFKKEELESLRMQLEDSLKQSWQKEFINMSEALSVLKCNDDNTIEQWFSIADRIAPILATSPLITGNPRTVKRLLNVIKMRIITARRREIPLDEAVITKLVIFERCVGNDITKDFYSLIDEHNGRPPIFDALENDRQDASSGLLPQHWFKDPVVKDFIFKWAKLTPYLHGVDLRGAVYLSRETLPMGLHTEGLSSLGQEVLNMLMGIKTISTPKIDSAIAGLPLHEAVSVMTTIVDHLRTISEWVKKPEGFQGAVTLARSSNEAAVPFVIFLRGIHKKPPWMQTLLKDQHWYQE